MTFETAPLSPLSDFRALLQKPAPTAQEIQTRVRTIYHETLAESTYIKQGNFTSIAAADLRRMFEKYDAKFFEGRCQALTGEHNTLKFRLSNRMTSAAGKTYQRRHRNCRSRVAHYEIAISTALLYETFNEELRPITVSGVSCVDRLEALQRVMEHEMLHLIEMLIWDKSSCRADRFRSLAHRFFGHSQSTHQLITPREIAHTKYGILPGQRVTFTFEGRRYVGVVNRVTKRATVLVPDPVGEPYSDGKRYAKYYIPLPMLTPINSPGERGA